MYIKKSIYKKFYFANATKSSKNFKNYKKTILIKEKIFKFKINNSKQIQIYAKIYSFKRLRRH